MTKWVDPFTEAIECAIARHWPDVAKVCAKTGATPEQVHAVIDRMDELDNAKRLDHDCAAHLPGELACHLEHNCWCPPCRQAARAHARNRQARAERGVELRAHSEYERLRRLGVHPSEMPAWVRTGQRRYDRDRKRAQKDAAA